MLIKDQVKLVKLCVYFIDLDSFSLSHMFSCSCYMLYRISAYDLSWFYVIVTNV
jgi:hypothetical protein